MSVFETSFFLYIFLSFWKLIIYSENYIDREKGVWGKGESRKNWQAGKLATLAHHFVAKKKTRYARFRLPPCLPDKTCVPDKQRKTERGKIKGKGR